MFSKCLSINFISFIVFVIVFLPDPGVSGVRSMGPGVPPYESFGWDFTDVTLASDDANSMLADDDNRVIWGW